MRILLDTNVLLRLSDPDHPLHVEVKHAVERLNRQGGLPVLVPQVLYEFWVVATRPREKNGFGMNSDAAEEAVADWTQQLRLLLDERGVYTHWRSLVSQYGVRGKNAHDARLVAAMMRHGVERLLTYNKQDFARFEKITVVSPSDIMAIES